MDIRPASVPPPETGPDHRAIPPGRSESYVSDGYRRMIDALPDHALLLLDTEGYILTWNTGAEAIKGYRAEEIIGKHISVLYTPEAIAVGHPARELELAALTGRYDEEGWRVRQDGTRFWASVQILAIRDDDGDLTGFGKVTSDLTAQRQKDEQMANVLRLLEQTIRLDHLTGLPNRRAWDEFLVKETERAKRTHQPLAVALLDLDNFKQFNDQHGHLAGDILLKRASLRWRQTLRPRDLLARYGGEEFVLALPNCAMPEAVTVVERLLAATPAGQTLSAGLSVWNYEETTDDLISRSDRALYRAKAEGRNRLCRSES